MSNNRFTLKEFMEAWAEIPDHIWNGCIAVWITPLWWKITQIIYMVTLFGAVWFSLDAMIIWMDNLNTSGDYKYEAIHELIFWSWMFGTIAGIFVYRIIFNRIASKVLRILNCIDETDLD